MSLETNTTATGNRSQYTSVPLVPRRAFTNAAADSIKASVAQPFSLQIGADAPRDNQRAELDNATSNGEFDTSASTLKGARLRRERNYKKGTKSLPAWAFATGGSLANKAVNLTIDNSGEALSSLRDAVRKVSTILGTGSIGLGIASFAFQGAVVGLDLRGDVKRANAAKRAAGEVVEEGTEAVAKNLAKNATEEIAEVASKGLFRRALKGLGLFAKRIPFVGAAVTAGFVAYEVYSLRGNEELQRAALTAGFAEVAGNVVGFGAGDAAREGVRSAFIAAGGEQYEALNKSDIRSLAETGIDLVTEFNNAAPGAQAPTVAPTAVYAQKFAPAMG